MKKTLLSLVLLVAIIAPWTSRSQSLAEYAVLVDTVEFQSIVATGTQLSFTTLDNGYATFQVPFAFHFGGSSFPANFSVAASANGFLYLNATSTSGSTASTTGNQRVINPLLNTRGHLGRYEGVSAAYTQMCVEPGSGDTCFVIEYHGLGTYNSPYGFYSYQVWLYPNGGIDIIYDSVVNGTSAVYRCFLRDGAHADNFFLSGSWGNPNVGSSVVNMSTNPLPCHGLRIHFDRPYISCPRPDALVASAVSGNSATVSWMDNGEASSWVFEYNSHDFVPGTGAGNILTTTTNSVNLTGLDVNTAYYVYVRADCGGGDTSLFSSRLMFRTTCDGSQGLPYSEGFEGIDNNTVPACWLVVTPPANPYVYNPCVSTIQADAHQGSGSLCLYDVDYTHPCINVIASPMFSDASALQVSFYARTRPNYHPDLFTVGVVTTSNTFVPVDTITLTDQYAQYFVDLSRYSGSQNVNRVAFRAWRATNYYGMYVDIDDVQIESVNTCVTPTLVEATDRTSSSVTLQWQENGDATSWNVAYSTIPVYDFANAADIVQASSNPFTVTGLDSATTYYFYVQSRCSGSQASSWSGAVQESTLRCSDGCNMMAILSASDPYAWDGSYIDVVQGGSNIARLTLDEISRDTLYFHTCPNDSIFFEWHPGWFPQNGYGNLSVTICDAFGQPLYSRNNIGSNMPTDFFATITDCVPHWCPTPNVPVVNYATSTSLQIDWADGGFSSRWHLLYDTVPITNTDNYTLEVVNSRPHTITGLIPNKTYYVYVQSDCGEDVSNWSAPLVTATPLTDPTCMRPMHLAVSNVDAHTADLVWTDYLGTSWQVQCVPQGNALAPVVYLTSQDTVLHLTGLQGGVTYKAFVIPSCDTTLRSLPVQFTTTVSCYPPTYFDSHRNASGQVDLSWHGNGSSWQVAYDTIPLRNPATGTLVGSSIDSITVSGLTDGKPYYFYVRAICSAGDTSTWTSALCVIPNSLSILRDSAITLTACGMTLFDDGGYNGNYGSYQRSMVVMMPDSDQSVVSVEGTAWVEGGNYDYLRIYDGPSAVGVPLVDLSQGQHLSGTHFSAISSQGALTLLFVSDGTDEYAGFQMRVSCIENTCPQVSNITPSNVTTSGAIVSWTPGGNESRWQIEYGPEGFEHGQGYSSLVINPYASLTGLQPYTNFDIYVRPLCGQNDAGRWTKYTLLTPICDNSEEILIGSMSNTVNTYDYPVNAFYNYSYTQTIIDSAELAGLQTISAIEFLYAGNVPVNSKNRCAIYLAPTTLTHFTQSQNWIGYNSSWTRVYTGNLNAVSGWNTYAFDTTYTWDGHSNLAVIVVDSSGTYTMSSACNWATTPCNEAKTIHYESDNTFAGPFTPTPSFTLANGRANIQFLTCGRDVCPVPAVNAAALDYSSATVSWTGNSSEYELQYKSQFETEWSQPIAVNSNSYTLSGLNHATLYAVRVRQICEPDWVSDWGNAIFTTDSLPCAQPVNLHTTAVEGSAIAVAWNPGNDETEFMVRLWNTAYADSALVNATEHTFTGLTSPTTYNIAVRANCGQGASLSEWTPAIQVTTLVCQPVRDVEVSGFSNPTLSWTSGNPADSLWEIEYGASGFGQGEGVRVVANTNPFTLNLDGTLNGHEIDSYDFYVRTVCADEWKSEWSDRVSVSRTGISQVESASLSLYPNPASESTTLSLSGVEGKVEVWVVDMNGRSVFAKTIECAGDCQTSLQIGGLAQGTYFVRVKSENANQVMKLVVK